MKIVFWGTPGYCLPSLELLHTKHDIVAVVCQPDRPAGRGLQCAVSPVKEFALNHSIPVLQPEKAIDVFSSLDEMKFDIFVVIAYGNLIPEKVLALSKYPPINAHGSLLPAYRGAGPCSMSIRDGCDITGVSIMKVVKAMDAGAVMLQRKIAILPTDNRGDLLDKLSAESAIALQDALIEIESERAVFVDQNRDDVTFAPKVNKADGRICWGDDSCSIVNHCRAVSPFPGAFTEIEGDKKKRRIIITEMRLSTEFKAQRTGEIQACSSNAIVVGARPECIEILKVKPAGKREMRVGEFLNGSSLKVGDRFI